MKSLSGILAFCAFLFALLSFAPAQQTDFDQNLLSACSNKDAETVASLLQQGANPGAAYSSGSTVLHVAAAHGDANSVELLLKHGANPRATDNEGKTPLHVAMRNGYFNERYSAVVQLLLQNGSDPNAKANDGNTPLHAAASYTNLVQLLLNAGANPSLTNKDGGVPLHYTANLDCAKLLVQAGARVDAPVQLGITPIRLAAIANKKPIYDFLLATNGGKEPPRQINHAPPTPFAQTPTSALLSVLTLAHPQVNELHEELLRRGKPVVPEVLKYIQSGKAIGDYEYLLGALGPDAEGALPLLVAQLANKSQVYSAITTIDAIKPGTFASLPEATRQKAAESLYYATLAQDDVMVPQFIRLLSSIGKPAAPAMLLLLRNPRIQVRHFAAEELRSAEFSDQPLEAELLRVAQTDEHLSVRQAAIESLGYFAKPDQRARALLLAFINNLPAYDLGESDPRKINDSMNWCDTADRAGFTLARFGPDIIDDLLPFLTPINARQRRAAIRALECLGVNGIPRLAELQLHEDSAIAIAANMAIDGTWHRVPLSNEAPNANDALLILLTVAGTERFKDETRLWAAFRALRIDSTRSRESLANRSIIPLIPQGLESNSPQCQIRAAETARLLGSAARDTLPALRRRLTSPPVDNANPKQTDYLSKRLQSAINAIESELAKAAAKIQ